MNDEKNLPTERKEQDIEKLFQEIFDSLPEEKQEMLGAFFDSLPEEERREKLLAYSYRFQGPIPHPALLKGYAEADPKLPAKIIAQAQTEQNMRADVNQYRHVENTKTINSSTICTVAYLGVMGIVAWQGAPILALSFGALAILPAMSRFIRSLFRHAEKSPDNERNDAENDEN